MFACLALSTAFAGVTMPTDQCAAGTTIHQASGCTAHGHYLESAAASADDCCAQCTRNASCMAWTFHDKTACNLGTANDVKVSTSDTKGSICGCRVAGCPGASPAPRPSPSPPGPPVTCESVFRPAKPTPVPLPAGKTQPHFVTVLVDDLGFDDASIRGKNVTYSPNLQALRKAGILLDRHHTYLWCSPTRRAFLTGRYPAHITGTQAGTCTNFTPLQFTILSEKLAAVGYESHFIGKGHLGYQTTDHLPINRGFAGHLGFLGGGESYTHGQSSRCGDGGIADMWHDHAPAVDLVDGDYYNTNFFSDAAVDRVTKRNTSKPFWLHLAHQAVHTGDHRSPPPWELWPQDDKKDYISSLWVLDTGIGNLTTAMKAAGMWETTVFIVTSDNGGDCGLPAQPHVGGAPGYASNYPLLGRKCTAFDGGTRTAAFVAGGLIPANLRGTVNTALFYITDWYPTLSKLAGVDPADDWVDPVTNITHGIDGVDIWQSLMSGTSASTGRAYLPTTERSLLWDDDNGHMYKLITSEFLANRFTKNGSQYMDTDLPCLSNATSLAGVHARAADGLAVPKSCVVCSPAEPCLFDVLNDPSETKNLAKVLPAILSTMVTKLATFQFYVPALSPANLACYTCGDHPPSRWWQNFSGPCCVPNHNGTVGTGIN